MKLNCLVLVFLLIFNHCSFDNKSGIWKDGSIVEVEKENKNKDIKDLEKNKKFELSCKTINKNNFIENLFVKNKSKCMDGDFAQVDGKIQKEDRLKSVFTQTMQYNEIKKVDPETIIKLNDPIKIDNWLESFYNNGNNPSNIFYSNEKQKVSSSSRLAKFSYKKKNNYQKTTKPLIYNNNIISYDHKGTIYVYSTKIKKKLLQFNFYKKKFKKFDKKIYLIVRNDVIYAADNLGYLYAVNIKTGKLIWAKNYSVPFRSNMKIYENTLFSANQDNVAFAINLSNGEKIWQFASQINQLNSDFINNLILDEQNKNIIFFNTSGEVYSINFINQKINWVINLRNTSVSAQNKLFLANPMVINNNNIIISSDNSLISYNKVSGNRKWQLPITASLKIDISNDFIFVFTEKNLLVCLNQNGDILWSKNIFKELEALNTKLNKEKTGIISSLIIADNNIMLFSSSGYLLEFSSKNGQLILIKKISKSGFVTDPIFSKGKMFFFNKKYKLLYFN